MAEALAPIERRIYNFLVEYLKRETYQPSIREIGARFGIRSTKTVTEHLQSLQRKGYLDRTPSRSRALRILGLDLSPNTYTIPVYRNSGGRSRIDGMETRYELDRAFACSADCFLVRVNGDHLREQGVLDGDLLLVEPCEELEDGELAVIERGELTELHPVGASFTGTVSPKPGAASSRPAPRCLGAARGVVRSFRGPS